MARTMKRGSVIVDMAAASGGNCDLSQANQVVTDEVSGVIVVGKTNYPAEMAGQASYFLSQNFLAMLELMGKGDDLAVDLTEAVVEQLAVVKGGTVLTYVFLIFIRIFPSSPRCPMYFVCFSNSWGSFGKL